MKHVVCYSGGHSSALVAIEVVRKFGAENVILLNHDINPSVEDSDIKRFKRDVADYLGVDITFANHERWNTETPISVCIDAGAWKVGNGPILCTNRLKTDPFNDWLSLCDPEKENIYYYGFDKNELHRVQRRVGAMGGAGYKTDYPLALWDDQERTIFDVSEIGIKRPMAYGKFKHANCIGCLKAGWQHWYIVYCERPDIWGQAKDAEDEIGYAIHKDKDGPVYLDDKEALFSKMLKAGIEPTEHVSPGKFWSIAKEKSAAVGAGIPIEQLDMFACSDAMPCECSF